MNLATRHSCTGSEGWGALVSSWVGRRGGGRLVPDADGSGQMEMFEDVGGGATVEVPAAASGQTHTCSTSALVW